MKYVGGWDRADGKGAFLSAGGTAVVEIDSATTGGRTRGGFIPSTAGKIRMDSPSTSIAKFRIKIGGTNKRRTKYAAC